MRTVLFCVFTALGMALLGCGSGSKKLTDTLSGRITVGGQPLTTGTLMILGLDGREASARIKMDGGYSVEDPPKGSLKFRIVLLPPQPGVPEQPQEWASVPPRYQKYENELTFEFAGGATTYDIAIKP